MVQSVPTKGFVQPTKTATMCCHPEGDTHPPSSPLHLFWKRRETGDTALGIEDEQPKRTLLTHLSVTLSLIHWKVVSLTNVQLYSIPLVRTSTQQDTSKMIYHQGVSLSKHNLMFCHGTQTTDNSRICHCLLFDEHDKHNFVQPFLQSRKLLQLHTRLD